MVVVFCQNCGKNNEEGATFCHYCGTRIIENSSATVSKLNLSYVNGVTKSVLPFVKKFKYVFMTLGVIIVLLIAFIITGNIVSSPKCVVESYMKALTEKDYDKLYDTLDVAENDFNSKETFETSMHDYVESFNISTYDIEEISNNTSYASNAQSIFSQNSDMYSESSDIVKAFRVSYVTNASKTNTLNLQLIKQSENFLLFFPTYKVQADNYTTTVTLTAPEYVSAYFDGVLITEENSTNNKNNSYVDDGYNYYTLESVFAGVHTYEIKGDIIEDYKCELSLKDSYYSETPTLILKDSVCTELESKAQNFISDFYNHTVAKDDFSSLEDYFTTDESYLSEIESTYNSVKNNMSNSRMKLLKLLFCTILVLRVAITVTKNIYRVITTQLILPLHMITKK